MNKRIAALLLCGAAVFGIAPANSVFGADIVADSVTKTVVGDISYQINSDGTARLIDAKNVSGVVRIPASITLNEVEYPITHIGNKAFYGSGATSIILPSSITVIENEAFANCTELSRFYFGNASVSVGMYAFQNCTSLSKPVQAANVYRVDCKAFDGALWHTNAKSEGGAVYFGKCLYEYYGNSESFTVDSGIVSVSPYAFAGNTFLKTLDLGEVKEICRSAFAGCDSLSSVVIGDSLESIGISSFDGCAALAGDLVFPASLRKIEAYAFRGCGGITSVDLSACLTESIGSGAFYKCTGITKAVLPTSLSTVGNYSFYGCSSLSEITADGVKNIGYDAFRGCLLLSDKSAFDSAEHIYSGAFDATGIYSSAEGRLLKIGSAVYKTEESEIASLAVEDGVKHISPYAFYAVDKMDMLALPVSLESVGNDAFMSLGMNDLHTDIYVFAENDDVYADLSDVAASVVYVPEGKTIENDYAAVGVIKGITVNKLPDNIEYTADSILEPAGIEIVLNTECDGVSESKSISEIGYTPTYSYDFTVSPTVTVEYCGYETSFDVTLASDTLAGDLDSNGIVNTDDLILLRKYIAGLISSDSIDIDAAQVDGVDTVNTDDLVMLRKIIAGLI